MNPGHLPSVLEKWARANSLWYYHVSGGCCADEVMNSQGCKYDLERFGCLPVPEPEQADLLIVSTAVTHRMAEEIRKVYDRMSEPRYVMALGACANSAGAFDTRVTYGLKGVLEDVVPVDVYVPGCPPRPEAIMNGLIRLQEKIEGKNVDGSIAH